MLEGVDQPVVERECDHEGKPDRDQRDDHPRPKLVEVLDQSRLLAVAKATGQSLHALGDAVVLARLRWRRRSGLRRWGRLRQLRPLILVLAADRVLELAHPATKRPADLGQALCAEEKQGEKEQADDLERADVRHGPRVARVSQACYAATDLWSVHWASSDDCAGVTPGETVGPARPLRPRERDRERWLKRERDR